MAKKKNAPVLREGGGGGDQPTTITKSYAVRDKWLDKAKDNLVEFKSVDGEISNLKVNGQPAGGGGGGSATVQIINNSSPRGVDARGPIIVNNMIMTDMFEAHLWSINMGSSNTYTVPLASSGMQLYVGGIPDEYEPIITGDCTWDADNWCFIITGNCTITI